MMAARGLQSMDLCPGGGSWWVLSFKGQSRDQCSSTSIAMTLLVGQENCRTVGSGQEEEHGDY